MSQLKNFSLVFETAIDNDMNYEAEVDNASFNRDQGSILIEGLLDIGQVSSKNEIKSYYEDLCKTIFEKNYSKEGWEILKWKTGVTLGNPKKFGTVFSVRIRFDAKNMLVRKLNNLIDMFVEKPSSKADLNNLEVLGESLGIYNVKDRIISRLNRMPERNYSQLDAKYKALKALDLLEGSIFDLDEGDFEDAWRAGLSSPYFQRTLDLAFHAGLYKEFYNTGWYDMLELAQERTGLTELVRNAKKPGYLISLDNPLTLEEQDRVNEELEDLADELETEANGKLAFFIDVDRGDEFVLSYEYRF
jgi:hypothetical protein